jgi:hypothetical protein
MQALALMMALVVGQTSGDCACSHCQQGEKSPVRTYVAANENFVVRSYSPHVDAQVLAEHASHLHTSLRDRWFGEATESWSPKCEVIVHAHQATYLRAVGAGGGATLGSTLVRLNQGKIAVRRIDLLADQPGRPYETVGHEIVHVLFAERFPKGTPPRWAEEGAALLADSEGKRHAHRRDFAQSVRYGGTFPVAELMKMTDYPAPTRFAAFYGQSLVLVDFLTHLGEPTDFVRFVDRSMAVGHDAALEEVYGIRSSDQLEELWTERAVKTAINVN